LKGSVEAVDHIAQSHRQADVDDLLVREVLGEAAISLVVNRLQPCRFLSIPNDCCLRWRIEPFRQWIVAEVGHLFFSKSDAPTEHCVRWDSIIAIVDDGGR